MSADFFTMGGAEVYVCAFFSHSRVAQNRENRERKQSNLRYSKVRRGGRSGFDRCAVWGTQLFVYHILEEEGVRRPGNARGRK